MTTTLSGALPELRTAYQQLDAYAMSQGITIAVADFGGVRTLADTTRILKYRDDDFKVAVQKGQVRADTTLNTFRPIAPFGRSYHNYGAAFDVVIVARPHGMTEMRAQEILGAYAPKIGLRWGGYFSDPDYPHFELAIPLADAQRRYVAAGGTATKNISALSFDLSSFLPSLTPSTGEPDAMPGPEAAGFPDIGGLSAANDSGEAALLLDPAPENDIDSAILFGLLAVGLMAFAIKRRFF